MELICLGDSLTFGYGVRMPQRWTSLAAKESGWHIVNHGISGDTTGGMLVRLRTQILAAPEFSGFRADRPEIMIMGGANDIFYSGSDIAARSNMGAMIQALLAVGISPIIGIPMNIEIKCFPEAWKPLVDTSAVCGILESYFEWLLTFCKAFGINKVIDFRPDFLKADGSVDTSLFADGLHPNAEGHRLMADHLTAMLRSIEAAK